MRMLLIILRAIQISFLACIAYFVKALPFFRFDGNNIFHLHFIKLLLRKKLELIKQESSVIQEFLVWLFLNYVCAVLTL